LLVFFDDYNFFSKLTHLLVMKKEKKRNSTFNATLTAHKLTGVAYQYTITVKQYSLSVLLTNLLQVQHTLIATNWRPRFILPSIPLISPRLPNYFL
jgi:hypothetical protein